MEADSNYLDIAQAALARMRAERDPASPPREPQRELPPTLSLAPKADKRNESNEESSADGDRELQKRTLAVAKLRAVVSHSLRRWSDAHLVALLHWHLAVAFHRGGEREFRRYLPDSIRQLTDDDLADLVDWPMMASLEEVSWSSDAKVAARLARGAQALAAWWNVRRANARRAGPPTTPRLKVGKPKVDDAERPRLL